MVLQYYLTDFVGSFFFFFFAYILVDVISVHPENPEGLNSRKEPVLISKFQTQTCTHQFSNPALQVVVQVLY